MRSFVVGLSAVALVGGGLGLALAQSATASLTPSQISQASCASLAALDSADQTALVYYAAGHQQGIIDGLAGHATASTQPSAAPIDSSSVSQEPLGNATATTSLGTVTVTDPAVAKVESSAASQALNPARLTPPPGIGVLGLNVQAILTTCSGAPRSLLSDIIAANGGAGIKGTAATLDVNGATDTNAGVGINVGSPITTPPPGAASSAPATEVNNDLNAASQQLNNSIVSTEIKTNAAGNTAAPGITAPGAAAPQGVTAPVTTTTP